MSESRHTFEEYLAEGNVALFGCTKDEVPDIVREKHKGRGRLFSRGDELQDTQVGQVRVSHYEQLAQIREEKADIYFLDREAVKVLFADFPAAAHFVLVRAIPRLTWILGIPGFLRRMYVGLVRVHGIVQLQSGGKKGRWILIEHRFTRSHNPRLSLSAEIGVQGFLDYLRREHIRYVVPRFYEKLPHLNREGGDLDILVSDEDDQKLRGFLQEYPGPIGVDVWTVSRALPGGVTYFPPPIARRILDSAIDGPAGSRIPAPREAFLAFAYHSLYHKGPFAGVPSNTGGVEVNRHPENDYAGTLKRLAHKANVEVDIAMEPLDEYLAQMGWRPKLDTLAKLAVLNRWIWKRFFSGEPAKEVGLGVVILKHKALELGVADDIERRIQEHGAFKILRKKVFTDDEVPRIADQLRGGVWNERGGDVRDFLPAIALVVVDTNLARSARLGTVHMDPEKGIRGLKRALRHEFKFEGGNLIHSTDNTHESHEYLEVCFPEEADAIRAEIERIAGSIGVSWWEEVRAFVLLMPRRIAYRASILKHRLGKRVLQFLMR